MKSRETAITKWKRMYAGSSRQPINPTTTDKSSGVPPLMPQVVEFSTQNKAL
jgi:hypothetical protein